MDRLAFAVILLLAIGLWIQPYLTGRGNSQPAVARYVDNPLPQVQPAAETSTAQNADSPAPDIQAAEPQISPVSLDASSLTVLRGKEGFWRLGRTASGVWWFVSPDNRLEFLNTVTTVQPYQWGRDKTGIHYVSRDFEGPVGGPGDLHAWATRTAQRVLDMGFKGLGAWCHPEFHKLQIPITRDLNLWTWIPHESRRLYSPGWIPAAEHAIKTQVQPLADNINLVGYFIDNELDWGDSGAGPSQYFDNLPADDPNRQQVIKVIRMVWADLEDFNRDWGVELTDWKDLETWQKLPHEQAQAYGRLFSAWLSQLAADYFRITCGLIRKYDPNHLILGVRFRGYAPREVVRASRDLTDAQSINYYVSDARLDAEMFNMMYEQSGQPLLITEYSFHALDGRSGNRNTVGFAAQVLDQQARADAYHLFTTRAARVPYIVGVDWFQWSDEPPSGRSSDGEDVNFGVVDVDDVPYELLADSIRKTRPMLNPLHANSDVASQADVWRESFANKPVMHVPYLAKPINLNGELSDWSMASKLIGVRHSQTVGLERSKLPLPNVFLGWNDEGLFLAMEIFDNDIHGAPATGWWWTRDFAEFWISTRPVASDQNSYDVYSHQFFFVPNAWPGEDGLLGIAGQWHRPGDALKDHLIPHPDIRTAVRVLPDRYVVEMLIPAKALNGFDPRNQPALAFNLHVRNFQHATDYFWSAPKEVMTQLRPNTWGLMYLTPAEPANIAQSALLKPQAQ
ncbi:MAG TPA: hypothetical protein VNL70_11520 [Tepidisphaeraceae bacterium]|nr:hypothetical protein [Tepidisphaeraceae bacterium]